MTNPFFILLACSLAVFRCAECVAVDSGPFHVFKKLREFCAPHPVLCELVTCQYCVGSYFAMGAAALLWINGTMPLLPPVLWWAAIWGGQAAVLRTVRVRE